MRRINYISLIIGLMIAMASTQAQTPQSEWEFKINGGYNIGGSSPLPLPVEVRKIEQYKVNGFAPHVALEVIRWFNPQWGISAQLALDYKGFTVKNRVKNLHTEIEMGDEMYVGHFTGKNTTSIRNTYFCLPILANYRLSEDWLVQMGLYSGYLYHPDFKGTASDGYIRRGTPVGEKTIVDEATFDFSESQNKYDFGFVAAAEWEFYPKLAIRGQLAWGIRPLFPSDFTGMPFKMYNIYGSIGLSYSLAKRK